MIRPREKHPSTRPSRRENPNDGSSSDKNNDNSDISKNSNGDINKNRKISNSDISKNSDDNRHNSILRRRDLFSPTLIRESSPI